MSNHKLNIRSLQGNINDEYEIAEIVYTNGITGKEHIFSIWHDMDNVTDKTITQSNIKDSALTVFMHSPAFDYYEYDSLEEGLQDHLEDVPLTDLFTYDENIEKMLVDYHNGEIEDFDLEIPKNKQGISLEYVIADEEITDLLMKSELDLLEKSDLVELGKTIEDLDLGVEYDFPEDVEMNVNKAIIEENIEENELPFINVTFEKLNVEPHIDYSNNVNRDRELEQQNNSDEMELGM